uniref:Putative bpti/kunitz family of serine protease inhibitor n=1 Tax=Amblyomma americanum TaxID=6943 RepID=A0A0C9S4L2_AMBAM
MSQRSSTVTSQWPIWLTWTTTASSCALATQSHSLGSQAHWWTTVLLKVAIFAASIMKSWVFILLAGLTLLERSNTVNIPGGGPENECSKPPDEGESCSGRLSSKMWYFNATTNTCSTFRYLGCGGNANRFPANEPCMEICNPPTWYYEAEEQRL